MVWDKRDLASGYLVAEKDTGVKARDHRHNQDALVYVMSQCRQPNGLLEAFAGIGRHTNLFHRIWPTIPIVSWELCPTTASLLRKNAPFAEVICGDSLEDFEARSRWGVMLDFTRFTLLRTREPDIAAMLIRVFKGKPAFVQFNDCSHSKLHLNYRCYRAKGPTLEDYLDAFDRWLETIDVPYRVHAVAGHYRAYQIVVVRNYGRPNSLKRKRFVI